MTGLYSVFRKEGRYFDRPRFLSIKNMVSYLEVWPFFSGGNILSGSTAVTVPMYDFTGRPASAERCAANELALPFPEKHMIVRRLE